ncbi:hypothetical protein NL676_039523 [Syzygium grande]|nr:hypothetical protein NL676_039523 [Syzygium grande]
MLRGGRRYELALSGRGATATASPGSLLRQLEGRIGKLHGEGRSVAGDNLFRPMIFGPCSTGAVDCSIGQRFRAIFSIAKARFDLAFRTSRVILAERCERDVLPGLANVHGRIAFT